MTEQFANQQSITIALPVADRRTTFAFYAEGLGFPRAFAVRAQ